MFSFKVLSVVKISNQGFSCVYLCAFARLSLYRSFFSRSTRSFTSISNTTTFKSIGAAPQDPLEAYTPQCDDLQQDSDEYWICRIRHYTYTLYHPTSTCRMGAKDDPTAVVDPELKYFFFFKLLMYNLIVFSAKQYIVL
jgi:hypothetical protein